MREQPKNLGGRPLETGFSNNPVLEEPTLASQGIVAQSVIRAGRELVVVAAVVIAAPVRATRGTAGDTCV
jgi:hypothetical protein